MRLFRPGPALSAALLGLQQVQAVDINVDSPASIKEAASIVAEELVSNYSGDQPGDTPGNLPEPYFWWVAGAMFGALIDYWYYTGDDQYNRITIQAIHHQVGPNEDFMTPNQTRTTGNDDQAFWGMAAMQAAEYNFPNPPEDEPQWLALAQAVFNTQAVRWDAESCGGGLKWQVFTFNNGYNYKNTISNGGFFNIAARLGRYTGNETYFEWADRTWDWMESIGLISPEFKFFDGSDDLLNCTELNHIQWTYNAGIMLAGAAAIWNATESDLWRTRIQGILDATDIFFPDDQPDVMEEYACELNGLCDVDQRSFKGYLARWFGFTVQLVPWTADFIMPKLRASAEAAAAQCSGRGGNICGLRWTQGSDYDGSAGVGEQMAALEVMQANLVSQVSGPVTEVSGGTSKGDAAAGSNPKGDEPTVFDEITTADKAGAGILTTAVLGTFLGGAWWMVS